MSDEVNSVKIGLDSMVVVGCSDEEDGLRCCSKAATQRQEIKETRRNKTKQENDLGERSDGKKFHGVVASKQPLTILTDE